MGEFFLILIGAGLVSNLVLDYMLGADLVVAVSKKPDPAINFCYLLLIVMPVTAALAFALNQYILVPQDLVYLQLISLVLVTTTVVIMVGNIARQMRPELYSRIELFIPLVIVNCTVLGVAILGLRPDSGWAGSLFFGLGSALGFSLVLLAISAIRERIAVADVPSPFKGVAALLITLGLLSMAFMGFGGIS